MIGVERELLGGEPTINRPIVNEYGTNANHLEFRYSLMKANGDDFTESEQRVIETWLTSPKFSSELALFDCNDNIKYRYYGKFKLTSWETTPLSFCAVNFVFSVNGSYAFEHYSHEFEATSITEEWQFTVTCETDELEEYVYPYITISPFDKSSNVDFTLTNVTDANHTLTISTVRRDKFFLDCRNCRIAEQSGVVKFKDLGWGDVGNIYWPRLRAGDNVFKCTGPVNFKFEYDAPIKYVGGWLV